MQLMTSARATLGLVVVSILSSMENDWRTYAGKGPDLILCFQTSLWTLSGVGVVVIQEWMHWSRQKNMMSRSPVMDTKN